MSSGEWVLLSAHLPDREPESIGILLCDTERDKLHLKLRPGWWYGLAEEEEAEVYDALSAELERQAGEMGTAKMLEFLGSASHALRIGARQSIQLVDFEVGLEALYERWICGHSVGFRGMFETAKRRLSSIGATKRRICAVAVRNRPVVSSLARVSVAGIFAAILVCILCRLPLHPAAPAAIRINEEPYTWLPVLPAHIPAIEDVKMQIVSQHRITKLLGRRRKRLRLDHLTAQVPVPVQVPPYQPPQYSVDLTAAAAFAAPTLMASPLPQLPRFHSRHNRFVRIVLAIIAPLKAQGSTSERVGPKVI